MKRSLALALTNQSTQFTDEQIRERRFEERLRQAGSDPQLIYQELEMDSPYVDAHVDSTSASEAIDLHSHMFYELLLCTKGQITYLLGTERYKVSAGHVVFIPPGTSHRPLLPQTMEESYDRQVVWLSPLFMKSVGGGIPDVVLPSCKPFVLAADYTAQRERLHELFARLVDESDQHQDGWQTAMCGFALLLLVELERALDAAAVAPTATGNPIDQILMYVDAHLSEPFTTADAAHDLLMSESAVNKIFRRSMGTSFHRYVVQRRLIRAKNLMEDGRSATEAAETSGFRDYTTFYRAFKREYGISPSAYNRLER